MRLDSQKGIYNPQRSFNKKREIFPVERQIWKEGNAKVDLEKRVFESKEIHVLGEEKNSL